MSTVTRMFIGLGVALAMGGLPLSVSHASGGAYAPVLKKTPPAPGSIEAQMAALAAKLGPPRVRRVPSVQEVGVPPYPGASIEINAGRITQGNGTYIHLPELDLLSTDSPAKVAAFFQGQLANWEMDKDKTVIGGQDEWVFVGPWIKMQNGDQEHTMVTVDVASRRDIKRYLPGAKTHIEIDYVPPAMREAPNPDKVDFPPYVK